MCVMWEVGASLSLAWRGPIGCKLLFGGLCFVALPLTVEAAPGPWRLQTPGKQARWAAQVCGDCRLTVGTGRGPC